MVVFTRDLRLRDHPALCSASGSERLVAAFVFDDAVLVAHRSPNRLSFLLDSLSDLREQLRALGSDLVVRRGDWVREVATLAGSSRAQRVHVSADVSALAARRAGRLAAELDRGGMELVLHPGVTVLPPGATAPSTGGPWKVFTPFHRRWSATSWRTAVAPPTSLPPGTGLDAGALPTLEELGADPAARSPELAPGGETAGLARLKAWAATDLGHYEERHDDLPGAATSQISPYVHLGCLSPLEVATRLGERPGGAAFVRQLAWRDFYHQLLAARPEISQEDYRSRGDRWRDDPDEITAWREGRTGYPVVDAAMRQLRREGFMHNRARMIVASFLTKDLYVDWRVGAAHFMEWLVDGDVANNQLNWQWTAGTGSDTNPNRIFNPTTQSKRFDPAGDYIRRYVAELAEIPSPEVHEPSTATRRAAGYPDPIVDHRDAIAAYRAVQAELRADADPGSVSGA